MLDTTPIAFRALALADLPLLHRWLGTPHVAAWYAKTPRSWESVIARYAPRIAGTSPTRAFVILYAGTPIGYIQTYRIRDHPDYARHVAVTEEAAGLDVYIGEPGYVHQGLGAPLLVRFLRDVVFADPGVASCLVGPEPANAAAIRAYEKAGFRYVKTIQVPGEPEPERLMRIARGEVGGA